MEEIKRTIMYLWCIMDLHTIPNSFIRMPMIFFGSRNVQVLMHNNRMIELKIHVNTGFRMSAVYFKDSYKFINLPLCLLSKSFGFSNDLQKGFFLIT